MFAAGDVTLDCQHTSGETTTTFSVSAEDIPGEVQPFTITIVPYDLQGNQLSPQEFTIPPAEQPIVFEDVEWRRIDVTVQFSDGSSTTAAAGCNNDPLQTDITTSPQTTEGEAIPDGGSLEPGSAMIDTATLSGQSIDASGTVTYYLYDSADCSGEPVFTSGPLNVVNGEVPSSAPYTPSGSGQYEWVVVYSGDVDQGDPTQNSNFNAPAESGCGEETVIVGQVETDLTTSMQTSEGDPIPQAGTIPQGTDVIDTATLSGATDTAGGTVTCSLHEGGCPGTPVDGASFTVDVTNGVIPPSGVVSDLPAGTYNWVVTYSGDDQNLGSASDCGEETFTVGKAQPTVTTNLFDTDDNEIADGAVVPVGTSIYDTATIDGFAEPLTGTVTFALYDSADCTGTPVAGPFETTIGPLGDIDPSDVVELSSTGTYNWVVTYSGNDANESASSDCGSETVNVEPASPTITTEIFNAADDSVIDPGSVVDEDSTVYDTAILDGATEDATGTVTFSLYNNFTCTGEPHFTVTVSLNDDGTIPPTPPAGPLPGGTWNWTANYSGDDNNNPASTACGDEEFFIGQGEGGITTMVEDESGADYPDGSDVEVDTVLRDTAVLDGVTPDAGGSVTFILYLGADCSGDPVFTSDPVPVVDGDLQGPSGTFTFVDQGTYQWVAVYRGDENNAGVSSPCGAETIVVVGKPSSVTTVMFTEDDTAIANNDRVLSGTAVYDTAVVSPEEATGTLTYKLYDNANCSGTPIEVFTEVPVGDASPPVSVPDPGVYNWVVTYSGDAEYAESVSACSTETFYIALQPTIVTTMVDDNGDEIPNNTTIQAGDFIGDTAELIDATDDATGTVTYYFYDTADCLVTPVFAPQVAVTNGLIPPSGVFQPPFTGEWSIQAEYSGDNTNYPAGSECGTENFIVDPESAVTIWTTMRANGEVIPQNGEIRFLPATVTDSVTVLGVPDGTTGDVSFELFNSEDCSGAPVFTDSYEDIVASAEAGWSLTSQPFSLAVEDWGTYNWVVTATGDVDGDGEADSYVSACGEETFVGVSENPRTVNIQCTYNATSQLTTFTVLVAKPTTVDPDIDPNLIVIATPTDNFLNPLDPVTYNAYDSSNPDSGVNFVQQPWRQLTVQVTWPDGQTGAAFANCNTNPLSPDLTTAMFAVETTPIVNGETVEIGTQVYDTATLTDGTTRWSGDLTYTLYLSEDCASGTEVGSPQVFTLEPEATTLPPSAPVTVTQPGTYNWVVTYSGDQNNEPATSGCGEEFFEIVPLDVTVLTQVILDETGAAVPDDGSVPIDSEIYDTTMLDGALDSVTGQVIYILYSTADCSGDPVFTQTVTISNGVVPPSSSVTVDNVGTWNWVVSYSGDGFHNPATSACGEETVLVEQATPAITTDLSVDDASAGDEVYDTATMTGASGNAGGEVTYYVFVTDDCSGDPLYTLGPVTVVDGVVPNSPPQVFDTPGHYEWQAVYSGDSNNVGATSVCGTEPLDIVSPDLVVEKSAATSPIVAGEDASFTITVSNIGQGNAYDVVVTDDLPDGIEWVIDPAVDGCAITEGALDCTFDTLTPGESIDIAVTGITDAEICGFLTNVASATAENEPDDATGNNSDGAILRVDCANVRVVKTADTPEVTAGDTVSFTIEVQNVGLGRADDVQLVDTLPADIAPWTIDPAVEGCEIAGDGVTLTCDIGSLERGESFTVSVIATTDATECGIIVNEASATAGNEPDSATGNNSDDSEIQILCSEMVVTKSASSGVVSAGDDVSFTITAINLGEGTANDVVVTDALPGGLEWTETPDNPDCEIPDGVTLTCNFGDLAAGESTSVTVSATTDPADCGVIANRATVESSSDDTGNDVFNNQSRLVQVDVLCPDILVEKTASSGVVSAGDDVSFTIAVINSGEGIATNVTVEDQLPAGIEWTIDPAVEGCAIADGTLACGFDTVEPLETIEITVTGTTDAADCGVLPNTASAIAGNEPADVTGNNGGTAEITVNCPDIIVEKSRNGVPVVSAGDDVSFTVTVSNTGSGNAYDVVVTDELPDGIEWTIEPAVEGCAITDSTLECTFTTLPAGDAVDITVVGTTAAADCGILTNIASGTAGNEPEVVTSNNSDSAIVLVQCPDVVVEKTSNTPDVSAGDDVSFTIVVSNIGSGDAYDVAVTDVLPAGVEWSIVPAVEGCAITDGNLECLFATLEPGQAVAITVIGTTDAGDCRTLANLASADTGNEPDEATDNNSDSAEITVNCPDILIEKSTTTPIVNSGDEVEFTITVSNPGEGTAYDVVMTDTLPAGILWTESPDNPDCSISDDGLTLSCDIGAMEPGAEFSVTVTGATDAEDCGLLTNTANALASNEPDDDQFPNEAEASITVNCPDVIVVKTAGAPTVVAGEDTSFTITVSNTSEGTANNVTVIDELPSGIVWTIDPPVAGSAIVADTLECTFATLEPGQSIAITLIGATDAEDCGLLTNFASATADNESDELTSNNSERATLRVNCANLRVVKSGEPAVVTATDPVSFTIEVQNIGLGRADNVQLVDTLPEELAPWTIDPAVEGCEIAPDGITLTCDIGSLEPGESFEVTVVGQTDVEDCGTIANVAEASASNEPEIVTGNNADEAEIQVHCSEMVVTKSSSSGVVSAGDDVSYTITASNLGEGTAYNVVVTDDLPSDLEWTESPDKPDCEIVDGVTLTCDFGDLAPGESASVTVSATTDPADCGVIANRATVQSSSDDAGNDVFNNQSRLVRVDVLCPDILVEKTAGTSSVSAGDDISFTIRVSNVGDGDAYDVVVSDDLPTGIEWAIEHPSTGCSIADATLECAFDRLPAGESINITVTGTSDAADCGLITNLASATAANEADDASGNNSDRATLRVNCANLQVIKTADTPEVTAGDTVSFSIEVKNIGLGRAANVQLVDELPTELAPWTIDPAVEGCAIDDRVTLECDIGSLEPGESFDVTVTATTDAEDCGTIENVAVATAENEREGTSENDTDEAEIQVLCSEMVVIKSASSGMVSAGEDVSYTITAINLGEGTAYNVVVMDELPAGLNWTETPDNPDCEIVDGVTLSCEFGDLATGETASVTVTATTGVEDCGVLANRASVESSSDDAGNDIRSNQSRLVEIEVACADISIEKTTDTPVVSAGDDVSFTVVITNPGPGDAYDVTIEDELPAGVVWAIDPAIEGCAITDGTLECAFDTVPAGQIVAVTVVGTTSAVDCGVLVNTASVQTSNEADGGSDDNSSTAEIVIDCPDIVVEKITPDTHVAVGDEASFIIAVTNAGEGTAYDVVITDPLPEGFDWEVTGDYAEDCTTEGGPLVCTIPVLGSGETAEIVVSAPTTTLNCGMVENTANGTASNEAESAMGNNEASANLNIICPSPTPTPTPSPSPTPWPTPTDPVDASTPTPGSDPSTPISVLPGTGTGGSEGGLDLTVWAQIAVALMCLAVAMAIGYGKVRRESDRDDI